eukprot:5052372-Prymnesium_polylepis.1
MYHRIGASKKLSNYSANNGRRLNTSEAMSCECGGRRRFGLHRNPITLQRALMLLSAGSSGLRGSHFCKASALSEPTAADTASADETTICRCPQGIAMAEDATRRCCSRGTSTSMPTRRFTPRRIRPSTAAPRTVRASG